MSKPRWEYIYGINPAFEVLRGGRRRVHNAFLNDASSHPRLRKLATYLESKKIPVEWVDKRRLFDLAESKEHQGAVLKADPYPYADLAKVWGQPRLLLIDNVEDPHNVGAIIRCADCFGFGAVLLPVKGSPEVYPSVVKVSAGASEHLDIVRSASANDYFTAAVEQGYEVVALDMKGAVPLADLQPKEKLLLVIGGEAKAVGQFILNGAHHLVRIEQYGRINSLNASVAAGIAMNALALPKAPPAPAESDAN